mgnify:CR=1 FL=1
MSISKKARVAVYKKYDGHTAAATLRTMICK